MPQKTKKKVLCPRNFRIKRCIENGTKKNSLVNRFCVDLSIEEVFFKILQNSQERLVPESLF